MITVIAVVGLIVFAGSTIPDFELENMNKNALPNGWGGAFAAIPFAIWFFLAIEGVANVAEETINPQRNILIGFGSALLTLIILCIFTFGSSIGVAGWEGIVYETMGSDPTDSPLPLAISRASTYSPLLLNTIGIIGLFGLVASFHGIILAAGRSTYEFGKIGYAPLFLGKVHKKFKTPSNALIVNMIIGIAALITGKTGEIITIACFGALSLYIISMVSAIVLRRREPKMERPFKVPFYPFTPYIALIIASVALISITIYNPTLASIYIAILLISFIWFKLNSKGDKS